MKKTPSSSIPGTSSTSWGNFSTQTSSLTALLVAGGILRISMILYGEWQDSHFEVPYTDVDYLVFTDASRSVWEGGSPFDRYTYRYTPLLSYLLLPNLFLVHSWGKLVFSVAGAPSTYSDQIKTRTKFPADPVGISWLVGIFVISGHAITARITVPGRV